MFADPINFKPTAEKCNCSGAIARIQIEGVENTGQFDEGREIVQRVPYHKGQTYCCHFLSVFEYTNDMDTLWLNDFPIDEYQAAVKYAKLISERRNLPLVIEVPLDGNIKLKA